MTKFPPERISGTSNARRSPLDPMLRPAHVPSLGSLRAFEACARHLSFTRAAQELNVSQAAVSHRIRSLEELVGCRLLDREGGEIRLTESGRDYLGTVRDAITTLAVATGLLIDRQNARTLTVATHINFGLRYLVPALDDFRRRHPAIRLRIVTVSSFENLARHDYDVAVRYGDGIFPGMESQSLGAEECFPVCSRDYMLGSHPLRSARDLAGRTLIRTASRMLGDDWPSWLEAVGAGDLVTGDEIVFDYLYAAAEAAMHGLGVAMMRTSLVRGELKAGRLVEPFAVRLPLKTGYHLVAAPHRTDRKPVRAFWSWLLERVAADREAST